MLFRHFLYTNMPGGHKLVVHTIENKNDKNSEHVLKVTKNNDNNISDDRYVLIV